MAYATWDDLKLRLGLPDNDDTDEDTFNTLLHVASQYIDQRCNRTFGPAVLGTRTYRPSGFDVFCDEFTELVAVTVDGEPVDATAVSGQFGWPSRQLVLTDSYPLVTVEAHFGWESVPVEIVEATMLQANRLFSRSKTPNGVGGFDQAGATFRLPWRDPDVELLIQPYRRVAFA